MRILPLVLAAAACGSHPATPAGPSGGPAAFPAARFVPARPTYVVAARTVRDAQHAAHDLIDALGMAVDAEPVTASAALTQLLAVDPLSPEPVAQIGVDLDGAFAVFSEDVDPTFVVHLAAPEAMQAFLDQQRQRGLVTQSVIVDGTEVFDARLTGSAHLAWAIDHDWMWLHVALAGAAGADWFAHSHHPQAAAWAPDWSWADKLADKAHLVSGFVRVRDLVAMATRRAPDAIACARLFEPIGRVAVAIEGDGHHAGARLTFDLGPAAQDLASHLMPPPPGWAATAAQAPLSAQWNADLRAVAGWLQPCANTMGASLADLDRMGARTARALLLSLDPDDKSGSGAVALDLASKDFFVKQLDQIPMRSHLEKDRTFGGLRGHSVSIPFVASFDYVLDDHLAIAAMGDGVLARVATPAPPGPLAVASIDIAPPGLSAKAWSWLLELADLPHSRRFVERLLSWQDAHVSARVDGTSLVIEATGNRR